MFVFDGSLIKLGNNGRVIAWPLPGLRFLVDPGFAALIG